MTTPAGPAAEAPAGSARVARGLQPVATLVPGLAQKALGHKGVALGSLLADWATIAGPRLAERTAPMKLAFNRGERTGGVLHIRVAGAVALDLQHAEPQILDRLNSYFGYRAVERLKLVQGPLAIGRRKPLPALRPLGTAEEEQIIRHLDGVEDAGLKAALLGFGRAIAQRRGG